MTGDSASLIRDKTGLLLGGAALTIFLALIFSQTRLEITSSSQTTQSLLTTLAITQATAVSIVASVTLLNVQLVADRYSTQLVRSSLQSSIFKIVLFSFVGSIAIDLILLYNIEHHPAAWFVSVVIFSAVLAIINAWLLYKFIFDSVGVLTPNALISTITSYETEEIAEKTSHINTSAENSSVENSEEEPLHQLYVIVSSSIGEIDYFIVEKGLNELYSILRSSIKELRAEDRKSMTNRAFSYYYPKIVEKCMINSEFEQAEKAVSDFTDLLEEIESEADYWHTEHFAGIEGIFKIWDADKNNRIIDSSIIISSIEYCPKYYWEPDRINSVFSHAKDKFSRNRNLNYLNNIILKTHESIISPGKKLDNKNEKEVIECWQQEAEKSLADLLRESQSTESEWSKQILVIFTRLYHRKMTELGFHRKWLVTIIFEVAVLHSKLHNDTESGKLALLNTLRGAQSKKAREHIEELKNLSKRYSGSASEIALLNIAYQEENPHTAYQYSSLSEVLVSEAIDSYRKENWRTQKAIEYIQNYPSVASELLKDYELIKPPNSTSYDLITDPKSSNGKIIKIVVAEKIDSELIDSLSADGVSQYLCVGPVVTGDFDKPNIITCKTSLPELRPPAQSSIYDYYNWN